MNYLILYPDNTFAKFATEQQALDELKKWKNAEMYALHTKKVDNKDFERKLYIDIC